MTNIQIAFSRLVVFCKQNISRITVIIAIAAYLFVCLTPFFLNSFPPLGYDTGLYRRYILNESISFPSTAVPGLDHTVVFPRILLDCFRLFISDADYILYGSYILFSLIFVYIFYVFTKVYTNNRIASIATVLLVLSPINYLAYWFLLYKSIIALSLVFLCLIFLHKEKYFTSCVCAVMIPLSHQSTTVYFLASFFLLLVLQTLKNKSLPLVHLGMFIFTLLMYLYLHPHVSQKLDNPPVAVFVEKLEFLILVSPLIALSFIAFWRKSFARFYTSIYTLLPFAFVGIIFPLFSLPFYQRIFIFTNLSLIFMASVGLFNLNEYLNDRYKKHKRYFASAIALIFVVHLFCAVYFYLPKPLMNEETYGELKYLETNTKKGMYILTTPSLAPWVSGWTTAKVFAPGMFKDSHKRLEWEWFWSSGSDAKIEFLRTYDTPLYIFVDDISKRSYLPSDNCIIKLSLMLYKINCEK